MGNPLADPQLNPDVYHYRELIYTCRKGYAIVSSISAFVERRCLLDGSWSSKPPVCWVPCPAAAIPHNGFISDTIQYEVSWDGRSNRRWQSRLPYGCKKRVEIWNCRNSEICPRGLIVVGPIRAPDSWKCASWWYIHWKDCCIVKLDFRSFVHLQKFLFLIYDLLYHYHYIFITYHYNIMTMKDLFTFQLRHLALYFASAI